MTFPWQGDLTEEHVVNTIAAAGGLAALKLQFTPRRELQKDADGFYPGERETGLPDFLRRTPRYAIDRGPCNCRHPGVLGGDCDGSCTVPVNPANSPPASSPTWVPPWAAKS